MWHDKNLMKYSVHWMLIFSEFKYFRNGLDIDIFVDAEQRKRTMELSISKLLSSAVVLITFFRARRLIDKWTLEFRYFIFYEIQSTAPFRLFLKFRLRVAKSFFK